MATSQKFLTKMLVLTITIGSLTASSVVVAQQKPIQAAPVQQVASKPTEETPFPEVSRFSFLVNGQRQPIVDRLVRIHAIPHEQDLSFHAFIIDFTKQALEKNIRQFPITDMDHISDPKTMQTPVILIPENIENKEATLIDGIKISALPKLDTDQSGVKRITQSVEPNSLIWLPKPYIVAGSFHREMYPHDTSAIIWAILELAKERKISDREKYISLIKDELDNFAFQTNRLGYPLNGNRGYYITRSQTNIIPSNVLEYYVTTGSKEWLQSTGLPMSEDLFDYWIGKLAEIKIKSDTAYRWIAHGDGPCAEVMESHEAHHFYYFQVLKTLAEYSKMADANRPLFAQGFNYNQIIEEIPIKEAEKYLDDKKLKRLALPALKTNMETYLLDKSVNSYSTHEPVIKTSEKFYKLSKEYYRNDRASRVSGYDTNHLYGPFNAFTYDFIPADHNFILYKSARDIASMHEALGNKSKADKYNETAKKLKSFLIQILWDEKLGMFFDFDATNKRLRVNYPFLSSAYALWAGIFDVKKEEEKAQLLTMVQFLEKNLEGETGFYASSIETGLQWDKPYVWPVQQQYIVGGLREYADKLKINDNKEGADYLTNVADRIAVKYLLANYADWLSTNGQKISEKIIQGEEHLLTGYDSGNNYTWNITCTMYLYNTLSEDTRKIFDVLVK